MFGACFATLTFPWVQAARAGSRQRVAAGSMWQPVESAPSHPTSPSSILPQQPWEGDRRAGKVQVPLSLLGGTDPTPGLQGQCRVPTRHWNARTPGLQGCQVTWGQPHPSPKTVGQPGQRQDPKGPLLVQGAQLLLP